MPRTSWNDIKTLLIPIPPLNEQTNICDTLLSLDEKINNERKKLQGLLKVKQALMQVLLTGKVRVPIDDLEVVET